MCFTFLSASVASWNFEFNEFCSSVLSWSTRCFSMTGTLGFWGLKCTSSSIGTRTGRGGLPAAWLTCPWAKIPCPCGTP